MNFKVLTLCLIFSSLAMGAEGGSSAPNVRFGKGSAGWLGLGSESRNVTSPDDVNREYSACVGIMGGGDLGLVGPLYFSISFFTFNQKGTGNYKYTHSFSKAVYSAKDVAISQTTNGADLGLQLRLINTGIFHLYIEAGGLAESWNMNYDFTSATSKSGAATPEKNQSDILALGSYGKLGIDLIFTNGYGVRLFGRVSQGTTSEINSLDRQKINFTTASGFLSAFRQF